MLDLTATAGKLGIVVTCLFESGDHWLVSVLNVVVSVGSVVSIIMAAARPLGSKKNKAPEPPVSDTLLAKSLLVEEMESLARLRTAARAVVAQNRPPQAADWEAGLPPGPKPPQESMSLREYDFL